MEKGDGRIPLSIGDRASRQDEDEEKEEEEKAWLARLDKKKVE